MDPCRFSTPLVVRIPAKDDPRVERIEDVRSALTALSLGVGDFQADTPDWHIAFDRLVKAKLDPTPDKVDQAHDAFRQLALRTNSLVAEA